MRKEASVNRFHSEVRGFAEFAVGRKHLAWVGSAPATQHLGAIGVDENVICNSVEEAALLVRKS